MKNKEIEEILNELKDEDNYIEEYGFRYKRIALDDWWLLLSYIEQLEKENDRLKKDYSIIVNENCDYLLLEKKVEQLENNRNKAIEILGNYKHYSTPTEEQNRENEEIVDNAYNILKGGSDYE